MLVIVNNGYVVDFSGSPGGKFALHAGVPAKICSCEADVSASRSVGSVYNVYTAE
jgi:hypothetical protein